jgi:hypothetical protein
MKYKDTKSIDIVAFLQKIGFSGKLVNSFVWYCSPFRNEKTASFTVDTYTNRWRDHGTGQNGDMLDLVKLIYNTDAPGALAILSGLNVNPDDFLSFSRADTIPEKRQPGIIINHIQPIANKALIQYFNDRKIPLSIAKRYTEEAYYTANNKRFFSIAFRNDKGGYELRNKYPTSKTCVSPKYFTSYQVTGSKELNLFEGFFDALSLPAFNQVQSFTENTLVLNSLSMLDFVIPLFSDYQKINLYLDNDTAGQEAANKIRSLHPCTVDKSKIIYPLHKDFNEFLVNNQYQAQ